MIYHTSPFLSRWMFNRVYPDKAIERELKKLRIRCPNDGCNWLGGYQEYDQEHASSCPMELIKCLNTGCSIRLPRGRLADHLENECAVRMTTCQYCGDTLSYNQLKAHYKTCLKYPTTCSYCDEANIPRDQLEKHQDEELGDCSKKRVHCEFKQLGCETLVDKDKKKQHNQSSLCQHMLLLLYAILSLLRLVKEVPVRKDIDKVKQTVDNHQRSIEQLTKDTKKLGVQIQQVGDKKSKEEGKLPASFQDNIDKQTKVVEETKNKLRVIETKVTTYEGIVAVLNNQIEQDASTMLDIQHRCRTERELIESLERKIKAQDRIIALKDVALAEQDLRIQSLEMASYDGVLMWKISDFNRKRQEALSGRTTSIYSPCFYTSRHGYKLCARVYLNGDGMGKGNHVSLFFVVMKSTFDALLRWPFRQKVTLMWLDQNNREHVIDAFRPDPTSSSFKRPTQDMNIASGCPLFMPISQLDSPRHAYIKDDVAFLKIIVDTSDLSF
ncbi:TNF receptor-associated factor 2-like isoform X2 [Glandiceps talaboti]